MKHEYNGQRSDHKAYEQNIRPASISSTEQIDKAFSVDMITPVAPSRQTTTNASSHLIHTTSLLTKSHDGSETSALLHNLQRILSQGQAYFGERIDAYDQALFSFCLHHLFIYGQKLYQVAMPELYKQAQQIRSAVTEHQYVLCSYAIWTQLQTITNLLERIDALSNLFSLLTTSIVEALDATCSITNPQNKYYSSSQHFLIYKHPVDINSSEVLWQQQDFHKKTLNEFSCSLQGYETVLSHVDSLFYQLDRSLKQIFVTLLPKLAMLTSSDDEIAAQLLLALQQQTDEIQFAIRSQREPLSILTQQYEQGVGKRS